MVLYSTFIKYLVWNMQMVNQLRDSDIYLA